MIQRFYHNLEQYLQPQKALNIRSVAEVRLLCFTTFLKTSLKYRLDSGDNIRIQQQLSSQDFQQISDFVAGIIRF